MTKVKDVEVMQKMQDDLAEQTTKPFCGVPNGGEALKNLAAYGKDFMKGMVSRSSLADMIFPYVPFPGAVFFHTTEGITCVVRGYYRDTVKRVGPPDRPEAFYTDCDCRVEEHALASTGTVTCLRCLSE